MKNCLEALNYQPHAFTDDDLKNLNDFLLRFFTEYPIHVVRQQLWELFRAWLFRCGEYADEEIITSKLEFYEQLEEFLEIAFIKTNEELISQK